MKKISILGMAVLTAMTLGGPEARAATGVWMEPPSYTGSGCPSGSVATTLSPDSSTLSVLFSSFTTEAGGTTGVQASRKVCQVSIPIHVPAGLRLVVVQADYRGNVTIPAGGRAILRDAYAVTDPFGRQSGPTQSTFFWGAFSNDYFSNGGNQDPNSIISACGRDLTLDLAASMTVRSNGLLDDALGTVDSVDTTTQSTESTGINYYLVWQAC